MLALIISSAVLLGWHFYYEVPRQKAAQAQAQLMAKTQTAPLQIGAASAPVSAGGVIPKKAGEELRERAEILSEGKRLPINSAALQGSISLKGARLDDVTLVKYHETIDKKSPEVVVFSPSGTEKSYFAEFGWIGDKVKLPNAETIWKTEAKELTPEKPVVLKWNNGEGLQFQIEIALDKNYMFTITQKLHNDSGEEIKIQNFSLINRAWKEDTSHQKFAILHEGPLGVTDGTLEEIEYQKMREEPNMLRQNATGWAGFTDKYWLAALVPGVAPFTASYSYYKTNEQDRYQIDALSVPQAVADGKDLVVSTRVFAGAKELAVLDGYAKQYNIPLFDRAVDFGHLYFITRPMFVALSFFNDLLGNFGLAILLLTVLVRLVLYPLANKSYASMGKMKLLMPKMEEIKKRYSDDKLKQNQEIMALYKREKVNPASGCLPLLVQIPVFFALYKVLFVSIEMRHAPFYGWVHDLSVIDPTNIFTAFGLLPWNPPSLLHVGIWPLLMMVTMIAQQKLNPKPADPVQAQVMAIMPYAFLFMFSSFPAGLVIYWTWNNALSVLQQWMITRKFTK